MKIFTYPFVPFSLPLSIDEEDDCVAIVYRFEEAPPEKGSDGFVLGGWIEIDWELYSRDGFRLLKWEREFEDFVEEKITEYVYRETMK